MPFYDPFSLKQVFNRIGVATEKKSVDSVTSFVVYDVIISKF